MIFIRFLRLGPCRCCLLLFHIIIYHWFWWLCSKKRTTDQICVVCPERYCLFWRVDQPDPIKGFEWWWVIKTLQSCKSQNNLLSTTEWHDLETIWPEEIELLFNMYRVGVFFWILMGLVWLSGVISIITELLQGLIQWYPAKVVCHTLELWYIVCHTDSMILYFTAVHTTVRS